MEMTLTRHKYVLVVAMYPGPVSCSALTLPTDNKPKHLLG